MPISEVVLYDQFARAREDAVELTDRYRDAPSDAPYRDELWEQVVHQTETARSLLESLLDELHHGNGSGHPQDVEHVRYEVLTG
jgi:hypothetical protein